MNYEHLLIEKNTNCLICSINNPPVNALGQGILLDIDNLLDNCLNDSTVRVIIITGNGEKLFSAGVDLTEYLHIYTSGGSPQIDGNAVFNRIESYPKPIIAAIQGSIYGGGLEMAMCCHLRIMSDSAVVQMPELKLGFIPGWGGTQRLPRYVGKAKAMEMFLTGRPISAQEALTYGLVNKIFPQDKVLTEARKMADDISQNSQEAVEEILKVVTLGLDLPLEKGILKEQQSLAKLLSSSDPFIKTKAFLEK